MHIRLGTTTSCDSPASAGGREGGFCFSLQLENQHNGFPDHLPILDSVRFPGIISVNYTCFPRARTPALTFDTGPMPVVGEHNIHDASYRTSSQLALIAKETSFHFLLPSVIWNHLRALSKFESRKYHVVIADLRAYFP
jgi:hypothetical protein